MKRSYPLILLLLLSLWLAACGTTAPAPDSNASGDESTAESSEENAADSGDETMTDEGDSAESGDVFRVAFVYVAPVGDLGWSYAHDQARKAMEEEFGDKIETTFVENVPEGPEATRVIRDFAQKGYDLIFTTSFGYMEPTLEVAPEFPDTQFVHISGYKTAPNMSTVFGRMYIPRYLSGLIAGAATESNTIGYVAAFPIPEVVRGLNAFTLGVRAVNPDATVKVVYTNTWFGPPEEREAAQALLDGGADVIAQHQDTTEPQKAAQEAGALSIGYDSDMREFVGDSVLTSPVWNWAPKYISIAQELMDGTYQGDEQYWGMEVAELAPLSPQVDARIADLVTSVDEAIRGGSAEVFCGPINDNTGNEAVAAGNCLTDAEMLSMEWYVEGVEGDAPAATPAELGEASDKQPASALVGQPIE
ncbi:MAG: BMP family ABC transporter substrate-binding protein [Anaerolineales bacterium]|nr:BMP family ABC transporter substrate-binding protein [Anaerolineales bacterium]MCB9127664.1 BMP family ABC transporter substrate-binding protein [Ardenticatenales bacterium]